MPLEVADPEDEFGDGGGARVDFDAEKLVRVHGVGRNFEDEAFAELGGNVEDFAFEPFQVFEGDIEEVAGAASGVEDFDLAEVVVKAVDFGGGFFDVAGAGVGDGGGADAFPFGAERFDDGGKDEAFDVGARGVVGAELVAFVGIEGALEQGAEDGGFDVAPVLGGGLFEEAELKAVDGQNGVVSKKAAVELEEFFAEDDGDAIAGAGVEFAKECLNDFLKAGAVGRQGFEEVGEAVLGHEADVFCEHAEEAAGEEIGDDAGFVSGLFEGFGEFGEVAGDFAGDVGGLARGIERGWIGPDEAKAFADFFFGKLRKADAEAAWVGKGEVGFSGLGEIGVDLEGVANVNGDEERRIGFAGRESADVTLGLAFGFDHGVVPFFGAARGLR